MLATHRLDDGLSSSPTPGILLTRCSTMAALGYTFAWRPTRTCPEAAGTRWALLVHRPHPLWRQRSLNQVVTRPVHPATNTAGVFQSNRPYCRCGAHTANVLRFACLKSRGFNQRDTHVSDSRPPTLSVRYWKRGLLAMDALLVGAESGGRAAVTAIDPISTTTLSLDKKTWLRKEPPRSPAPMVFLGRGLDQLADEPSAILRSAEARGRKILLSLRIAI